MLSDFDTQIGSRTLAQEARGEPMEGQQAVAWVLRNRLASGHWGHSIASVCLWRAQFSGWYMPTDPNFAYACGLPDSDLTLEKMREVLNVVFAADPTADFTKGAKFYYATSIPAPAWVDESQFCGQFGNQRFYRGTK